MNRSYNEPSATSVFACAYSLWGFVIVAVIGFIIYLVFVIASLYQEQMKAYEVPQSTRFEMSVPKTDLVSEVAVFEIPKDYCRKIVPAVSASQPVCTELGSEYWTTYINWMGGVTDEERNWLLAVSACESGRDNCQVNDSSNASGLFQVIPRWHNDIENVFDGERQIQHALGHYRAGGSEITWAASRACWQPMIDSGQVY